MMTKQSHVQISAILIFVGLMGLLRADALGDYERTTDTILSGDYMSEIDPMGYHRYVVVVDGDNQTSTTVYQRLELDGLLTEHRSKTRILFVGGTDYWEWTGTGGFPPGGVSDVSYNSSWSSRAVATEDGAGK